MGELAGKQSNWAWYQNKLTNKDVSLLLLLVLTKMKTAHREVRSTPARSSKSFNPQKISVSQCYFGCRWIRAGALAYRRWLLGLPIPYTREAKARPMLMSCDHLCTPCERLVYLMMIVLVIDTVPMQLGLPFGYDGYTRDIRTSLYLNPLCMRSRTKAMHIVAAPCSTLSAAKKKHPFLSCDQL